MGETVGFRSLTEGEEICDMDEAGPFSPKVSATLARLHAESAG